MDCKSNPETPKTWEEAKRIQSEASNRYETLLEEFAEYGYRPGLFGAMAEAAKANRQATEALEQFTQVKPEE